METNNLTINPPQDGLSEEIRFYWHKLPNKGLFFVLFGAWLLLFHVLGNSSLGYIPSTSLFNWMIVAYSTDNPNADDGHGNIIPFLVLGVLWWKRKELLAEELRTWSPALLLVGLGLLAHVVGFVVQQQRLSIIGLFAGIYGLMGLIWGPRWLRATFFPFFLFVFMVPFGSLTDTITFPLRLLVSWIVEHLFNYVLGIGVIRSGTQMFNALGTYQYEIAAACSGIRSLISIFLIAITYAFLAFRKPRNRVIMIVASLPLAIIGNTVRLSTIIAAGELKGQTLGNFVHENFFISILPYIPAIIGVIWIGRMLEKSEANAPAEQAKVKSS